MNNYNSHRLYGLDQGPWAGANEEMSPRLRELLARADEANRVARENGPLSRMIHPLSIEEVARLIVSSKN
ncbi:MAG: hypothetical protein AB1668_05340 [Nanoarchaeota archaeon]